MSRYFPWASGEWLWRDRTMTPQDIADSCELAAETLEGHWTQGNWYANVPTDDGYEQFYCLEGGLAAALGLDAKALDCDTRERAHLRTCPVYEAVLDTLALQYPEWDGADEVATWNDTGGRTMAEVLDLLHTTAKRVLGVEP